MIRKYTKNQNIFSGIADDVVEKILAGDLLNNEKIFSIRQLAEITGSNANTVQRAYDLLFQQRIIIVRRGIGFFVAPDGLEISRRIRLDKFINEDLIVFKKNVQLCNVPWSEIEKCHDDYRKLNFI